MRKISGTMNRSVNSGSSSSGSARWSTCEDDSNGLNLTIHGSAVPRATRPPRRLSTQPPNSPARPTTLPVDSISLLTSQLKQRLEEGYLSTRQLSPGSTHASLALDLSSITDSCNATDRSTTASSCDESEWSEGWTPLRPLLPPTSAASNRTYSKPGRSILKPCERVSRLSFSSLSRPTSDRREFSSERTEWSCDKCSRRTSNSSTSHSDLIDVYVETVNNTQLTKFFRPCVACNQVCCQCPPSPLRLNLCNICGQKSCDCQIRGIGCAGCSTQPCKSFSERSRLGEQLCHLKSPSNAIKECSSDEDRNSIVSRYLLERRFSPAVAVSPPRELSDQNGDSGNSTLQLEDSGRDGPHSILSRQHVSLSVMQLATAAQCARILADSLESVLELAKEELTDGAGSATANLDAFNQQTLLAAIKGLRAPNAPNGEVSSERKHP